MYLLQKCTHPGYFRLIDKSLWATLILVSTAIFQLDSELPGSGTLSSSQVIDCSLFDWYLRLHKHEHALGQTLASAPPDGAARGLK